ncbi:HAMP domain-containing histidine kinase [Mucilaginibacter limnophilus]|uniref:histidine kinase n=1 Tax=Mucilaginibacter limnophilus TaxID=1932778 RepID=A0A3S2UZT8_9SPHI|nr:HAMP domain-containing sensor histidine kinase [Mucilaginibacter limnophilus]RVT98042.1 HAMP domain-containing histidine kinase [Mucilaginibacter limnophilus]
MKDNIVSAYTYLLGGRSTFKLESRIFHAVCLVTLLALFSNIFLNKFIGVSLLSWLMAAGLFFVGTAYYYSRFRDRFGVSIILYNILSNLLVVVNYFYNSGIDGPTLLIFMLSCFINISVVPQKQYWYWISLNILLVIGLLLYQYLYPESVPYTYPSKTGRYVDVMYTYIVVALIISLVTTYIRRSYQSEKNQVEQKAAELEQANITKNKLFSILAHDLRSPLSSIQNYLEILDEYRLDEEERLSINRDLLKTTQNTQQMLSNLLMWTKSQMEGVNVNLAAVRLSEVLDTTLQVQKNVAHEKGIQLTNELKNTSPVIADPDMLQLIVRNLVNNAIKFTNPGGQITIASELCNDNECRISIKDNGIGIPAEQQRQMFSLKANSTFGTKKEKGVGLGLMLCKEFTELQNGRIWFESTAGEGTSFYLSLKLYKGDTKLLDEMKKISIN